MIEVDPQDVGSARAAVDHWRQLSPPVTAVCAHNHEIAMMLLRAMSADSIDKRDLAVMAVDSTPLAEVLGTTTIAIDIGHFTERVVERVIASLENCRPRQKSKPVLKLVTRDNV